MSTAEERLSRIARALAHPARMRIVRLLAAQPQCAGSELFAELPLAQSTVSEHLRVLRDAGLVRSHPVGTGMVYCLVPDLLGELRDELDAIARTAPGCDDTAQPPDTGATDTTVPDHREARS